MLIYLEKKAKDFPLTKSILRKLPQAEILEIDHYKNIFDKNIWNQQLSPALILAKQENPKLIPVPDHYGYPGKAYFFKTSLNCVFDCEYCYLKGNFKTQYPVIFVNYDEIEESIKKQIEEERKAGYQGQITLYASNYSDLQGLDQLSEFNQHFFPFMEQFDGVLMETRTKSANISSILGANQGIPPRNTEISFSLNPQSIIEQYEKGTAPLRARIQAINTLLEKNYKVWLRFLPLLPVENYKNLYSELLEQVKREIDMEKVNSLFIASLIYNQGDFKQMQKKNLNSDLRNLVQLQENGLVKIPDQIFQTFVSLFQKHFPEKKIYFDFV